MTVSALLNLFSEPKTTRSTARRWFNSNNL